MSERPTDEQINWAVRVRRQASTGTMVMRDGTAITPAISRRAQRIMDAFEADRSERYGRRPRAAEVAR